MRKLLGYFALLGLLAYPLSVGAEGTTIQQAKTEVVQQVGLVKACGEAALKGASGDVKRQAIADAEQRAVKKALARFIPARENEGSLYKEMLGNYRRYVQGDAKVLKEEKLSGKYFAYCEVAVDFGGISRDLKAKVGQQQNSAWHDTENAVFFVRLAGLLDEQQKKQLPDAVLKNYAYNFKESGFTVYGADMSEDAAAALQDSASDLEAYRQKIMQSLPLDVSLCVVGEIKLVKAESYEDSGYAEAVCDVQAVRVVDSTDGFTAGEKQIICRFRQTYANSGADRREAVEHVIKKAAFDSARELAHITYNTWIGINGSGQKQDA